MKYIIKCKICGKKFITNKNQYRYCSNKCRKEAKRIPKYSKICKGCGKEFKTYQKKTIFCSVLCANKYNTAKRKTRIKVKCLVCGKEYEIQQHRRKPNKKYFCSDKCRLSYDEKVTLTCKCGKKFRVGKTRAKTAKYCSIECRTKYQWDGRRKYDIKKGQRCKDRLRALLKYGNKCELCGWDKLVEVHHIDGNRQNHNIDNLCMLCPNCHTLTEDKYKKNKYYISKEKLMRMIQNERKGK